jgi:hypothetical protein
LGPRVSSAANRSDARRKSWAVEGPHFRGQNVFHFILDPRDPATLFAATYTEGWGGDIQRSRNKWHLLADSLPPILSVEAAAL